MGVGQYTKSQQRISRRVDVLNNRLLACIKRVDNYYRHRRSTLTKYKQMLSEMKEDLQKMEQTIVKRKVK
jgi:hypothetical protein